MRLICGGMRLKEAASMAVVVVPVANISETDIACYAQALTGHV